MAQGWPYVAHNQVASLSFLQKNINTEKPRSENKPCSVKWSDHE